MLIVEVVEVKVEVSALKRHCHAVRVRWEVLDGVDLCLERSRDIDEDPGSNRRVL